MSESFLPKRPVVTAYPRMPEAFAEAEAMSAYLKEQGLDAPFGSLYDEELRARVKNHEFDMLIVAGGDGSQLLHQRCHEPGFRLGDDGVGHPGNEHAQRV